MKRFVLKIATVAAVTLLSSVAHAGRGNVAYTVHNMSASVPSAITMSRYIASGSEKQICIFCHTPHNAQPAKPLWNKVMPTQTFNMYTSSQTLSAAAKAVTAPGPESLLCLSCHDGRTAMNVLHNTRNSSAQTKPNGDKVVDLDLYGTPTYDDGFNPLGYGYAMGLVGFGGYKPNLGKIDQVGTDDFYGGNLQDDHPISFSYPTAQSQNSKLFDEATVYTKSSGKVRFFGANKRLECSSCHDPHVNYGADRQGHTWTAGNADSTLTPFLVMNNAGSALCFSCHDK